MIPAEHSCLVAHTHQCISTESLSEMERAAKPLSPVLLLLVSLVVHSKIPLQGNHFLTGKESRVLWGFFVVNTAPDSLGCIQLRVLIHICYASHIIPIVEVLGYRNGSPFIELFAFIIVQASFLFQVGHGLK